MPIQLHHSTLVWLAGADYRWTPSDMYLLACDKLPRPLNVCHGTDEAAHVQEELLRVLGNEVLWG